MNIEVTDSMLQGLQERFGEVPSIARDLWQLGTGAPGTLEQLRWPTR